MFEADDAMEGRDVVLQALKVRDVREVLAAARAFGERIALQDRIDDERCDDRLLQTLTMRGLLGGEHAECEYDVHILIGERAIEGRIDAGQRPIAGETFARR